jgi:hypothetical protein
MVGNRSWYFHADVQPCADDDGECSHVPSAEVLRELLSNPEHSTAHQQPIHMLLHRHRCPLGGQCPSLGIILDDRLVGRSSCM